MDEEISVLHKLPIHGMRCMAYGHKTYCCEEDMEEVADWHEVIFEFYISSYKIKKEFPVCLEESVLEFCDVVECWNIPDPEYQYGAREHLLGVTKWKRIEE